MVVSRILSRSIDMRYCGCNMVNLSCCVVGNTRIRYGVLVIFIVIMVMVGDIDAANCYGFTESIGGLIKVCSSTYIIIEYE